ncbi:hypothetical protein D3C86_2138640 [compost metagenome]
MSSSINRRVLIRVSVYPLTPRATIATQQCAEDDPQQRGASAGDKPLLPITEQRLGRIGLGFLQVQLEALVFLAQAL